MNFNELENRNTLEYMPVKCADDSLRKKKIKNEITPVEKVSTGRWYFRLAYIF